MHGLAEEGWAVSTDNSTLYNRACVHCVPASSAIIQKKKKKKTTSDHSPLQHHDVSSVDA